MRTVLTAIAVAALAVLTALAVTVLPFYDSSRDRVTLPLMIGGSWLLFALAVWLLRRVPTRAAVTLVLVGAVAIGGAAMAGPPNTSTDSARYAWDGIVQNAGISPYAHVPTDPALAALRPSWLFPAPVTRADGTVGCPGPAARIMASTEPGGATLVCTAINRATVPTIYPPTAELLFAGVRALVPREAGYWPMQLLGLLASLGITVILLLALRRRGLDPRWAALWAWCPLVAGEAVTNSHIDSVGAGLLLVATLAVATGQRWSGGVALGAAIATKLIPVIGVPALLRRQPWKLVIASVTTFLLLYLPYLISSGPAVLGYLPGYLSEEGYDDGSRFALISVVARGRTAFVVAAVLLVVLAVLVALKTDPRAPWVGQLVMIGVTLLIVSPRYPWYGLLLVPFVAMSGRWEWLAVPLALLARQLEPHLVVLRVGELLAITLIVLVGLARSGPPRREWFRLRGGFGR